MRKQALSKRDEMQNVSAAARASAPRKRAAREKAAPLAPAVDPSTAVSEPLPSVDASTAAIISGVEGIPATKPRPEGLRAKQLGVPEVHVIRLEPCFFPDDAQWLRTAVGLVMGVAVAAPAPRADMPGVISPVCISYNPTPIPPMRCRTFTIVAELAGEQSDAEAVARAIVLNREGNPLAIGDLTRPFKLAGMPRIRFPVEPIQTSDKVLLTVALEVLPVTPGTRAIVRSVWAEIEG